MRARAAFGGHRLARRRAPPPARSARPAPSDLGAVDSVALLKLKNETAIWNRRLAHACGCQEWLTRPPNADFDAAGQRQ